MFITASIELISKNLRSELLRIRKKSVNKQNKDLAHSRRRLKERFDLELPEDEVLRISNAISFIVSRRYPDIKVRFMEKESNTRTKYNINYKGLEFIGIYSNISKCLVTAYPIDEYAGELQPWDFIDDALSVKTSVEIIY